MNPVRARLRRLLPGADDVRAMRRRPFDDLIAGLTVAVVALPLALGFGAASGLGASAGLITAIVAGAVAAIFGGSNLQVSGPTGAMTVVLVPVMATHGVSGVLTVGILAGVALILLALTGAGAVVRFIPAPVIEGFTVGIAAVILLQQFPAALGVSVESAHGVAPLAWDAVTAFARAPHWTPLVMAVVVTAAMLVGMRRFPAIPFSIIAVALATAVSVLAGLDVAKIGRLPSMLPAPSFGFFDWGGVPQLATAALAVAALAAIESLLSATVADGMTVGQRHDPDRELFGQGLANLASPIFGGMPATAAIARTAVNVRAGAGSRLASFSHAIILAAIMFAASPLVSHIPLAALAGVLIATAVRMVEISSLTVLVHASRSDAAVLAVTAVATLALDLVVAVLLGLLIAGALAIGSIARAMQVEEIALDTGDHEDAERDLLHQHIVAYRIDGPLFFAPAHRFLMELTDVADVRIVILRLGRVTTMDATGALVLRDAVERLENRGITVLFSGLRPQHERPLTAVGLVQRLRDAGRVFATTPQAIEAARTVVRRTETPPEQLAATGS